ncbi:MAG: DUF6067 family protein, partial [Acidobacteriota bacterium]|nr:DUF6067 family protein [Acidobacteriota bacterium]
MLRAAALGAGVATATLVAVVWARQPTYGNLFRAPAPSPVVDGVVFEAGNWTPHLAAGAKGDSWGNHRAVIEVDDAASLAGGANVRVTIPWRRHDANPAGKAVVVVDAASDQLVRNALALRIENASGDIVFQPVSGSTKYYAYYMPWQSTGGSYPVVTYRSSVVEPDPAWAAAARRLRAESMTRARVTRVQSVDAFHSFFPMEVIATAEETARFMRGAPTGWRLSAEHRDFPVRMRRFIPKHWADRGAVEDFSSHVLRDEYFTFQVAVVAGATALDGVRVSFEGFPAAWQKTLTCFNCGGVDENGRPFMKTVSVGPGEVQPLWMGVQVPLDEKAARVSGRVAVTTGAGERQAVVVSLDVDQALARNHGFDEPELMSRLAWLNSTAGTDPDFVIQPYTPVAIGGADRRDLSVLGRTVVLGPSGLPARIQSYFTPELTTLAETPEEVLARPVELQVIVGGQPEAMQASAFQVTQEARGRVSWMAQSRSDAFLMRVHGALEYDGMLDYRIDVQALRDASLDDVVLPVSLVPDAAEYMLGLGRTGSVRPEHVEWTWQVENHQEGVWLGSIHKGLQYVLRDDNYERPLNTNFYQSKPLNLPPSWYNNGRGGIRIDTAPGAVTATNYSGARAVLAGTTLHFNVRFLITPFKPIDTKAHFNTRFVHKYVPVDAVKAAGGTVVNIHHANEINPYINYPFFNLDRQTAYITEAHA